MRDTQRRHLPEQITQDETYVSEYAEAELEMLRMAARGISTGSSLGMPSLQVLSCRRTVSTKARHPAHCCGQTCICDGICCHLPGPGMAAAACWAMQA